MKGIILAGGLGTRLSPMNKVVNKHLLPIFDRPMIFYPLQTLAEAGITDVILVTSGPHAGTFLSVLRNGQDFGVNLSYAYQDRPDGGIADALSMCETFAAEDDVAVILGDNTTDANISNEIDSFSLTKDNFEIPKAHIFLKKVKDPNRFGVAEVINNKVISIEEKPSNPKSNLAVTGLYIYDNNVFKYIKTCKPSARGQLEITDVNNIYIKNGKLSASMLGGFWKDAGTPYSMLEASIYYARKSGINVV